MKLFSKSGPAKPRSRTQDTPVRQNRDNRTVFILVAFCLVCGVLVILLGGLAVRITAYAAAAALILFVIVFTITYINLTFSKNKVQYM